MPDNEPVSDLNPSNMGPAPEVRRIPYTVSVSLTSAGSATWLTIALMHYHSSMTISDDGVQAPAASTQAGAVPAAAPAVLPAARKRTGRAQTVPVFDSEEEEAPSAKDTAPSANGVLHLPYPLVDEPKGKKHVDYPVIEQAQVSACPGAACSELL